MADRQETTYRFGPRPNGGIVLGLRLPQIIGFLISGVVALSMLHLGGFGALLAGAGVMIVAAGILVAPFHGHTIEQWTPITIRFLVGQLNGQRRFRGQVAQVGHVVRIPTGGLDPQPVHEPKSAPVEVATLELLEIELAAFGHAPMGAIKDKRAKTYTAVLACQGSAFELLDAEEQENRLADYGGVLAALTRDETSIRRISWYQRTVPGDRDALAGYMVERMQDADLADPSPKLLSYLQNIDRPTEVNEDHELLFAIQIDAMRPNAHKAINRMGKGDLGALAVLAAEVDHVVGLLDEAGIFVTGVLTRRGIAAAIKDAYDPWGRLHRARAAERSPDITPEGVAPVSAWPIVRDESWSHIAADGALHATFWVAEWPRIDVRALFLQPFLTSARTTRTIAMVMELVGPAKAIRRAERDSTEAATEQSLRERVGQRTTGRQRQREQAVSDRERELTEGHAAVRYAAYVSVSTPNTGEPGAIDDLEAAVQSINIQAGQASLRLERMSGQHAEAFTYTLPLCRGLQ